MQRLRLLRELQVRGTLAAVSSALHQSPSSVSQQLSILEREAGAPLLRRAGRGVLLTAQGEVLANHAEQILRSLELAEAELATSHDRVAGTLRVAVFQSAALAFLPSTLSALRRAHPELRVTVTQREPETALGETWARDFDLVVAEHYPDHAAPWHAGLDRVDLTTDAIRLAVPPSGQPWSRVSDVSAAASLPWVMEPQGAASRHWAEQRCRSAGFEPDVRFETADLQAHVALVESGNAVALLPDLMSAGRTRSMRLVDLPGVPHRTIFTAARAAMQQHPGLVACRAALSRAASGQ
jgi:DNA-binding transcriptional LysR family regulator